MEKTENGISEATEAITDYFSKLPDERTREYEKQIAKLASTCSNPVRKKALERIMDSDSEYAFEAFYCLCTFHRRSRDYELMRKLINSHMHFSDRLPFNHIVIQYQVHSESLFDFDELLKSAYDDANKLEDNAGYLQAFCNAFATICENCNPEDQESIINRWYPDALRLINKAVRLDPTYAKFYWTKARILALKGEFDEANTLISQAISFEDSTRPDYFLTILNYQNSRTRILMLKENQRLVGRIAELEKKVAELSENVGSKAESGSLTGTANGVIPDVYEGCDPYAFVSYAHKDKESVYGIISELQKGGVRIWYDNGIRAGEEWPEEIGTHLNNSGLVIVMLSSNAINSKFVRREINAADTNNKRILTVVLDECKLTVGIQLQLGLNQMIQRSRSSDRQFIKKLIDEISQRMGD